MRGVLARFARAVIHIYFLVGFQHRLIVSLQWLWRYLTYEPAARPIWEDVEESGRNAETARASSRVTRPL